jgi:hypothetical protein
MMEKAAIQRLFSTLWLTWLHTFSRHCGEGRNPVSFEIAAPAARNDVSFFTFSQLTWLTPSVVIAAQAATQCLYEIAAPAARNDVFFFTSSAR